MHKEAPVGIQIEYDELSTLPTFLAAREDVVNVQQHLAQRYRLSRYKIANTVFGTEETFKKIGRQNTLKHGIHPSEIDSLDNGTLYLDAAGVHFHHVNSTVVRRYPLFELEMEGKRYGISAHREHYKHIIQHEHGHGILGGASPEVDVDRKTVGQLVSMSEEKIDEFLLKTIHVSPFVFLEFMAQNNKSTTDSITFVLKRVFDQTDETFIPWLREQLMSNAAGFFAYLNQPLQKYVTFCKKHVPNCQFRSFGRFVMCSLQLGAETIRLSDLEHPSLDFIQEAFAETYALYGLYKEFEAQQEEKSLSFADSIAAFKESSLFKGILQAPSIIILPLLDLVVEVGSFEEVLDLIKESNTLEAQPKKITEGVREKLAKVARAQTLLALLVQAMESYESDPEFEVIVNLHIFDMLEPNTITQLVADSVNDPKRIERVVTTRIFQHRSDNPSQFFANMLKASLEELYDESVKEKEVSKTENTTNPTLVIDIFKESALQLGKASVVQGTKELIVLFEELSKASN